MKVLLVSEYFPPKTFGGGELSAYNLAKALSKKGFKVTVLTSKFDNLKKKEKKDGFSILRKLKTGEGPFSIKENLKRRASFQKSLKKELKEIASNYDVVHFLNTTSIPNFKLNNKTVATINSYTNFCPKSNMFYKEREVCTGCNPTKFVGCITSSKSVGKHKMQWYMRFNPFFWAYLYKQYLRNNSNLRNVDKFLARSKFISNLIEQEGAIKKNINTSSGLMDIKESGPRYKINTKDVNVTYIGPALGKFKGVEMLIKAFNKTTGAKLLIFGKGKEEKYLRSIAGKNVKFCGTVDYSYLPSIHKQSDIIVQPALWPEPLSRVMVEALLFGNPIIATNNGGNSECVVNGKNGFLIDSEEKLAEKLQELIDKPKLREKMGLESKKLYANKFAYEKVLAKIVKTYSS